MSKSDHVPAVSMPTGLSIGYSDRLAQVGEEDGDIVLEGGTHYLLARNGRGKTTLLRTLAGVLHPLGGRYQCSGHCQFLSEEIAFDRELPAKTIFKAMLSKPKYKEAIKLARKLELDVDKYYGRLSTGNKRKVALLVAEFSIVDGRSNILLLDEPFTGLDAFAREIFQELWSNSHSSVLRLVSCHPDFDSMEMNSSVLITEGKIIHLRGGDVPKRWGELKVQLN